MIVTQKTASVKSAGIQDAVSFGIKEGGMAHIFSVLRNQLYSDKILAVVREYSCNAKDANVEAGKASTPIVVTLPNRLNLNFKVRDVGHGLTENDIHEIYAFYGESTKRNSNAFIGQLGLGSKSAFAYGDNFVINSFVKGTKNSYNAFIDDSQVGQIVKLNSEKTSEPDGVEIVIPVRAEDISAFVEKAQNFFQHFKIKPEIKGATIVFKKDTLLMSGSGWLLNERGDAYDGSTKALMGDVAYPIQTSALNLSHDGDTKIIDNLGLVFEFGIGELEVAASREGLQYSKRTIEAIKARIATVKKEVAVQIADKTKGCKSLFEAKSLYASLFEYGGAFYFFAGSVGKVTWNNTVISDSYIRVMFDNIQNQKKNCAYPSGSLRVYEKSWRGSSLLKGKDTQTISCRKNAVLILNDLSIKNGVINRINNLVLNEAKMVFVLTVEQSHFAKFFTDTGLIESDFIKLSSLTFVPLVGGSSSSIRGVYKSTKHSSKEFVYLESKTRYSSKCSDYWESCDVDFTNGSGVYVRIEKFEYFLNESDALGFSAHHPSGMEGLLKGIKKLNIAIPKIYGFKPDSVVKAKKNKNFISLSQYVSSMVKVELDKNNLGQRLANRISHKTNCQNWWRLASLSGATQIRSSEFANICNKILLCEELILADSLDAWQEILTWFHGREIIVDYKPSYDIKSLNTSLTTRYPMIPLMNHSGSYYERQVDKQTEEAVINYVNLIDKASQQV